MTSKDADEALTWIDFKISIGGFSLEWALGTEAAEVIAWWEEAWQVCDNDAIMRSLLARLGLMHETGVATFCEFSSCRAAPCPHCVAVIRRTYPALRFDDLVLACRR